MAAPRNDKANMSSMVRSDHAFTFDANSKFCTHKANSSPLPENFSGTTAGFGMPPVEAIPDGVASAAVDNGKARVSATVAGV